MTFLAAEPSSWATPRQPRRVLVAEGGSGQGRSAVAAVRALAAARYEPVVTITGGPGPAAASRHCTATVDVPPTSSGGFGEAVHAELQSGRYAGVLPVSDAAVVALGLDALGLIDKRTMATRAAVAGMSTVSGFVFDTMGDLRRAAGDLTFPLVMKAATASAEGGKLLATRIDRSVDLLAHSEVPGPILVQPHVAAPMSAVAGVVSGGRLAAAVHQRYVRTWPTGCGTASYAVSVRPDTDREARLVALLEGYDGIFQAQFLGPHLIDLNPRVYGSLPLAVAAGANLPAIVCDLARGADVPFQRGRAGVRYRWVEGDLRHLARAVRRGDMRAGEAATAMRPRLGTAHSVATLGDPLPFASALIRSLRRRM